MTERYDVTTARKYTDRFGEEKTAFTRIGVAFPGKNGALRISLEALPLQQEYNGKLECTMMLFPAKPREQQPVNTGDAPPLRAPNAAARYPDDDTEIPF